MLSEPHPLGGQLVETRRANQLLAVGSEIAISQVVRENVNHIRTGSDCPWSIAQTDQQGEPHDELERHFVYLCFPQVLRSM